ncbi:MULTISPECIES: hypothetical protein [Methylobacterium]|uniref:Uncharacterized protein n=1 Tax=Methylobacterium thuringiense TaxID=1003091 RepID=A0ABQ4THW2_9HYPH|nr:MULTISPECIES: hypothetical protein [Methylobacterium]TXN22558.1 hypothetical protein FV217_10110 [Methylobacterium sp. WL9]GJE53610.1 hypothetical protein EKPJFOCH_0076 [Methylobacterium thuringiense]
MITAPSFGASASTPASEPVAAIRVRAAGDARQLRALARAAQRDGMPKADLRSATALAAARRVVEHARRLSSLRPRMPELAD